jgi:hypothetical protein
LAPHAAEEFRPFFYHLFLALIVLSVCLEASRLSYRDGVIDGQSGAVSAESALKQENAERRKQQSIQEAGRILAVIMVVVAIFGAGLMVWVVIASK